MRLVFWNTSKACKPSGEASIFNKIDVISFLVDWLKVGDAKTKSRGISTELWKMVSFFLHVFWQIFWVVPVEITERPSGNALFIHPNG